MSLAIWVNIRRPAKDIFFYVAIVFDFTLSGFIEKAGERLASGAAKRFSKDVPEVWCFQVICRLGAEALRLLGMPPTAHEKHESPHLPTSK